MGERRLTEEIDELRRIAHDFLEFRVLRVEHAQRVGVEPPLAVLVELVLESFEIGDQLLAVRGAFRRLAQRIDLEAHAAQSEVVPKALAHQDDLGIGIGTGKAERLDTHLMKLPVTAALRPLVPEHRARVPEALRTVVQQIVFDRRAHHGRGVLGAQRQVLAIERVGEAVHLLLDDIGHFADAAREKLRVLDDRRADVLITVGAQHRAYGVLEKFPQHGLLREDVVHPLDAGEFR
jgi:hypothetical protein